LRSLWRELFTDEEASNFAASVLGNLGIPGVILSPKLLPEDEYGSDNEIDGDAVKREFKNRFGGDNRGEPLVMMGPTDVNVLSWSPQQLDLAMNRRVPEERVTAVLGIHPMVVGLGAGLARSTFSNYGEARAAAYENTIIPWQRLFSAEIASQLLDDFETDSLLRFRVMFDLSEVRALADDQDALWRNADIGVKGGWAQVAEARQLVGLPVDDSHRIYLRNFRTVEVSADGPSPLAVLPNGEDPNPNPEDDDDSEGDEDDDDDDDSDVEERALKAYSPDSYVEAVTQATLPLMDPYADSLEEVFNTIGQEVADAYLRVEGLKAEEEEIDALVGRVMNAVAVNARFRELATELTTAHYTRVAEIVFQITGEQLGISMAFNLDDPVGIRVLEEGGKRMGLVDITEDTRRALFRTFADARELGEGPYDVARRIRQNVPAGRFTKAGARYRSVLIARTETKYAQNFSSLEAAKATETVTHMLAFDAQLGNSDPDCEERDGMQFTIREAEEAMRNEHPNGTLNFAPITN